MDTHGAAGGVRDAGRTAGRAAGALRPGAVVLALTLTAIVMGACDSGKSASTPSAAVSPTATAAPARFNGSITLDGRTFEAPFVGARVIGPDGLLQACQAGLPDAKSGRYAIDVLSDAEVAGCGEPGARVALWISANNTILFSTQSAPWSGSGETATFDAAFSSADPVGAGEPATGFYVTATQGGEPVAVGTAVRALIDGTVCAESTIRNFGGDDVGAIVTVAGPQVDGCVQGGRIVFEVGGQQAAPTATNDLMDSDKHNNLELTVP